MSGYFVAPDGNGDLALWTGDPDRPTELLRECDLDPEARRLLWPVLVAGSTPTPLRRTFIVAPFHGLARSEAHGRGLDPTRPDVVLVTHADHLRGYAITDLDEVVPVVTEGAEIDVRIWQALRVCRLMGGSHG